MTTSNTAHAWLLDTGGLGPVAVADHALLEYLSAAHPQPLPLTPPHCQAVIFWRDQIVPLLAFQHDVSANTTAVTKAALLAYQTEPGQPLEHIALALRQPPQRVRVDDDSACGLPEENRVLWQLLAVSCFIGEAGVTPIVDIQRLASPELAELCRTHPLSLLTPAALPPQDSASSTPREEPIAADRLSEAFDDRAAVDLFDTDEDDEGYDVDADAEWDDDDSDDIELDAIDDDQTDDQDDDDELLEDDLDDDWDDEQPDCVDPDRDLDDLELDDLDAEDTDLDAADLNDTDLDDADLVGSGWNEDDLDLADDKLADIVA